MTVSDYARVVRANNAGMMTLDGTNTWILREPSSEGVVIVDPGPLIDAHLDKVRSVAEENGGRIALVLYSHWHADHTESIDRFAELTGAPARALDTKWCRNASALQDGETIRIGGLELEVYATPGHTSDSLCILMRNDSSLLTADTILGRGTTVVAHPDGNLRDYLASLRRLRLLIDTEEIARLLPGHGPVITSARDTVEYYLAHREDRLQQVRAALEAGDVTARQVVERVYADVDQELWWAAEMSVRAQLDYLEM